MTTRRHPHPLPFYNGVYWFDNSIISSWLECSRNYEYEWQELKAATYAKAALNYGKGMHVALAALALSCGSEYTNVDVPKMHKLLDVHFDLNPQPEDDHRTAGLAKETMARYCKAYECEPWTILTANGFPFVERVIHARFSDYNGIPINYFGVMDLAVQSIADRSKWVVDHKTTSVLGKQFDADMQTTGQMKGYCWLYKKCFIELPQGYIVDAIRSLAPSEKAKADQKALDKWWSEQFRRLPFYVDQEKIDEWERYTSVHLHKMLRDWEDDTYEMNTKSCVGKYGLCQFYHICTIPFVQRLTALQSNNFMENNWIERTLGGKV